MLGLPHGRLKPVSISRPSFHHFRILLQEEFVRDRGRPTRSGDRGVMSDHQLCPSRICPRRAFRSGPANSFWQSKRFPRAFAGAPHLPPAEGRTLWCRRSFLRFSALARYGRGRSSKLCRSSSLLLAVMIMHDTYKSKFN